MRKLLLTILCLSLSISALSKDEIGAKLFQSACNGDFTGVTSALNRGAAIDWKSPEGYTPLLCAAKDGHLAIVQYLVANGAQINKHDNERGKTPLLAAAFQRQFAVVQYLVAQHADLNVQAVNGWTAMHDGAYVGDLPIVRILVQAGANRHLMNELGETPLGTAVRARNDCRQHKTACPITRGDTTARMSNYDAIVDFLMTP